MAPTYPDISRCQLPLDLPPYAKDLHSCPPYNGETPIPFTFPTDLPMRTRIPAHLADEAYIAKYSRAIQLMRDLPPEDPRSFVQQANIHCAYCQGSYFMDTTEKLFKVHAGWFFFPFHRCYAYFHERILAKLLGDDTFALPFWNYDYEPGMTIPAMYLDKNLPLYNENRTSLAGPDTIIDLSFVRPDGTGKKIISEPFTPEQQICYNYKLIYKQVVCLAKTTRAFHGSPRRSTGPDSSECNCAAGTVESAPHNTVHGWTGSLKTEDEPCPSQTCYGEDMGAFYSAARDPLFFAHHCSLDRLWSIWQTLPGRKDYMDPDLLDTRFLFYDENCRLVSIRTGDVYDNLKLRYKYETVPTPWLQKQVETFIPIRPELLPPAGDAVEKRSSPNDIEFFHPVKISVPRPKAKNRFLRRFLAKGEERLFIEGIRVQRNLAVKFDVFINLDDRLVPTSYVNTVPKEYSGTFVELPRGARFDPEGSCGQSSTCVGIAEVLQDLNVGDDEESIMVTLIPKLVVQDPIKISGIKIEYCDEPSFGGKWINFLRSLFSPSRWGLCSSLNVFPAA